MTLRLRGAVLACFLCAGCSKPDPYLAVVDKQVANWNEMADILATATDPESMKAAEAKLAGRVRKFQEVESDRKFLAPPDDAAAARILAQKDRMQAAVNRVQTEMRRIRDLPGGPEFFDRVGKMVQQRGP